jgi:hypothetical protein
VGRVAATGVGRLRTWFAAWIVGVLLLACGAPCSGIEAAKAAPHAAQPADPCRHGQAAPRAPCAQAACQTMAEPPPAVATPQLSVARADLLAPPEILRDRREAPPTPPPRLL